MYNAILKGMVSRGNRVKVFDWDKAIDILLEKDPILAYAGLKEDMGWTCGVIWRDGKPNIPSGSYLSSTWATPIIEMDDISVECWSWEDECEYNSGSTWTPELIEKLKAQGWIEK